MTDAAARELIAAFLQTLESLERPLRVTPSLPKNSDRGAYRPKSDLKTGGPLGDRTQDPLIKSQMLYH